MDEEELESHLSQITTVWKQILAAQQGASDEAARAREQVLLRYDRAVLLYLRACLGDEDHNGHVAEELAQEFALKFVRGAFKHLDPGRGRFRDYVKAVLRNLVSEYRRKRNAAPASLDDQGCDPAAPDPASDEADREFLRGCREALLLRAWQELAEYERQTGSPYHTVLRCHAEDPGLSSAELARQVAALLGKESTAEAVRQLLHRARLKYADFLAEVVARSLPTDSLEEIEKELIELDLQPYCKSALERRKRKGSLPQRDTR
jgi:RNA polymerase sigma-70 factor (ECF subfamily)